MLICAPTYIILCTNLLPSVSSSPYADPIELFFPANMLLVLAIETASDQQQWNFHQAKHRYFKTAKVPAEYKSSFTPADLDRGFLAKGLFAYSRHPNYACEMGIWLNLCAWGCYASGTYWNWTVFAAIGYVAIFLGSTPLTENITKSKYEEYSAYQSGVGRFVPDPIKMFRGGFRGALERAAGKGKKKN